MSQIDQLGPDTTSAVAENSSSPEWAERISLLWSGRQILIKIILYAVAISTVLAFLIPVRYVADAKLMPPDNNSGLAMLSSLAGSSDDSNAGTALASSLLGMKTPAEVTGAVLQSRTVEDRIIGQYKLQELYRARTLEDARDKLEDFTSVDIDRRTGILTISVSDQDPKRAAAIVQTYVLEANKTLANVSTSAAHRERVFLESRLQEVKTDLDSASQKLAEFSSKNTTLDLPEQGKAMFLATADLQGQLIAARSQLKAMGQIYSNNNPRLKQQQAAVAELERQMQNLTGADPRDEHSEENRLYPSIRQLPLLGLTYVDLYRRVRIDEAIFEMLNRQYEVAKIQEARDIGTLQVLDQPEMPTKIAFPKRPFIILGGTLCVFILAGWSILHFNRLDLFTAKGLITFLQQNSRLLAEPSSGMEITSAALFAERVRSSFIMR